LDESAPTPAVVSEPPHQAIQGSLTTAAVARGAAVGRLVSLPLQYSLYNSCYGAGAPPACPPV